MMKLIIIGFCKFMNFFFTNIVSWDDYKSPLNIFLKYIYIYIKKPQTLTSKNVTSLSQSKYTKKCTLKEILLYHFWPILACKNPKIQKMVQQN